MYTEYASLAMLMVTLWLYGYMGYKAYRRVCFSLLREKVKNSVRGA